MQLAGELAVRLLDLVVGRRLLDAEHLVGIPGGHYSGHHHPRGAQDDVAHAVAALDDLDHVPGLDALRGLREERLVDVRVERPVGRDLLHALGGEHAGEGVLRHADALEHLRLLVVLGGIERALEVVEHGQELGDEPLARAGVQLCLLARDPLAVVVEVRRDPAQVVDHLLVLALGVLEPREQLVGVRARLGEGSLVRGRRAELAVPVLRHDLVLALARHDVFAASSSSMTS